MLFNKEHFANIEITKIQIIYLCQYPISASLLWMGGEMDNTKNMFSEVFIELSSAYGGQALRQVLG